MNDWGSMARVTTVTTMSDGEVVPGYLHVLGAVPYRAGRETALEMLNRPEGFFAMTFDEPGVLILSKAQVVMAVCPIEAPEAPDSPDEDEADARGTPMRMNVRLTTGEELEGEVRAELPSIRARPIDYLNATGPFFELRTDGAQRFINRAYVRAVRPLD